MAAGGSMRLLLARMATVGAQAAVRHCCGAPPHAGAARNALDWFQCMAVETEATESHKPTLIWAISS
jgi:hypothetical protein